LLPLRKPTNTTTPAGDDRALELGLGLGIGIPSFLVGFAAVFYAILRDRKKAKGRHTVQSSTNKERNLNSGDETRAAIPSKQEYNIQSTPSGPSPNMEYSNVEGPKPTETQEMQ